MHFQDLQLIDPLLRAVQAEGYTVPSPIQAQAIPHVLAGRDLIACAQTGTGKTAAFALPLLQQLALSSQPAAPADKQRPRKVIRVLVLSPTRELASQIAESFAAYGRHTGLKTIVVFGGVGQQPQVQAIRQGADILVATPGRLLDLIGQNLIRLNTVEKFVLDEADRMLDMGFIHDVKKIIATLPTKRQTLLFSATMPAVIQDLANHILINPVKVEVTPQATTVEKILQSVYFVDKKNKRALLEHLLEDRAITRVLVFSRTKHGANKLAEQLEKAGIVAEAIHGNKSQSARERALLNFKTGKCRVLVATDIAARGIDVDDVTHVINFDLPFEPESYVHRIGRTARAGASGVAYSFCDADERKLLVDIERLIRMKITIKADHPYPLSVGPSSSASPSMNRARPSSGMGQPSRTNSAPAGRTHNGGRPSPTNGGRPATSSNGRSSNGRPNKGRGTNTFVDRFTDDDEDERGKSNSRTRRPRELA